MASIKTVDGNKLEYDSNAALDLMNDYASVEKRINSFFYDSKLFLTSNIVGEYAELLATSSLGLTKCVASQPGYDAIDANGKTYQIKSRWMNSFGSGSGKEEFGKFKLTGEEGPIDYLVLVVFLGDDFNNAHIYLIDLVNDFWKILNLQNNSDKSVKITPKIFSKQMIDGSYKCYYRKSFARLIELGLMKEEKARL